VTPLKYATPQDTQGGWATGTQVIINGLYGLLLSIQVRCKLQND